MFSGIHLSLVTYSQNKIALRLPAYLKIMLLLVAILFLYIALDTVGLDENAEPTGFTVHPGPLVMAVAALLGVFYRDRWLWDGSRNLMQRQIGLLFLYKKKTFRLPILPGW